MNKKLMAVAVGAALAAPMSAFAAVELSGRANVGIGQWSATGATAGAASDFKGRLRVWDSGSNITIKASEDLGSGLSVDTYIETGINIDQGDALGQSGAANSSTGYFGSRQAWVGLKGGFGKVQFGRINTWYGSGDQDLAQAVYLDAGIQFASGVLATGPNVNRQSNALRYNSPMLGPVEILVTYSPVYTQATNPTAEAVPANADNGKVQAVTVQGSQGQFSGGFDMVTAQNGKVVGAATGQKNTANKIRGGFKYQPGAQISLIYVQAKQEVAGVEAKQTAFQINWEHNLGNIGLHAGYGKANNRSAGGVDVTASGTTALQFGVRFINSKTTYTYINYVGYTNDNAASLNFVAGGMSSGTIAAGADPKSLAFGISHRF